MRIDVLVQGQNLMLVSSLCITLLLYYYGIKILKIERKIMDLLLNSFIYGLLVWKCSYFIFHPSSIVLNPIGILYFNGGYAGIGIGIVFVGMYTWLYVKKHDISLTAYINAVIPVYLGYFSTFLLVNMNQQNYFIIIQAIVAVCFFILSSLKIGRKYPVQLLIWFHVIQFELTLCKNNFSDLLSKEVLFYIFIFVILVVLNNWRGKKGTVATGSEKKRIYMTNQITVIIMIITLAVASFTSNSPGKQTIAPKPNTEIGINKGQIAPDFELLSITGSKMKLSDFHGKTVILNFWATWCPPCKAELPELKRFYQENKNKNIEVVGVNLTQSESNSDAVKDFVKNNEIEFPVLLDETGKIGEMYKTITIPTSFIIDKNGVITNKQVGAMSYETMKNLITNLD